MKVKPKSSVQDKAKKSLLENTALANETVAEWDDMLQLLDEGWEVMKELDDNRFLMKKCLLKEAV